MHAFTLDMYFSHFIIKVFNHMPADVLVLTVDLEVSYMHDSDLSVCPTHHLSDCPTHHLRFA